MAESVLNQGKKSSGGNILTRDIEFSRDKETKELIRKMSEKELLQNIAYDIDTIARLIKNYFIAFTIIFIMLIVFTFVGPIVQKAVGL